MAYEMLSLERFEEASEEVKKVTLDKTYLFSNTSLTIPVWGTPFSTKNMCDPTTHRLELTILFAMFHHPPAFMEFFNLKNCQKIKINKKRQPV